MSRITAVFPVFLLLADGVHAQPAVEAARPFELGSRIDSGAFVYSFRDVGDRTISLRLDQSEVTDGSLLDVDDSGEQDDAGWNFQLAPYVWMAGVKADTAIGPFESSGEADFIDLVKRLDIGAMLHFEGRKERWGFILDGLYMKLSDDARVRAGPFKVRGIDIDGGLEMTLLEAGAFYRFGEAGRHFDALAGVRYLLIDVEVDAGPLPTVSGDKDWVDPFLGGRLRLDLSEKWLLSLRGDIGGFGVGSDLTWNVTTLLGYRLSETKTLGFGYRHLDIDYEDGDFSFDAQLSGPYFGLSIRL